MERKTRTIMKALSFIPDGTLRVKTTQSPSTLTHTPGGGSLTCRGRATQSPLAPAGCRWGRGGRTTWSRRPARPPAAPWWSAAPAWWASRSGRNGRSASRRCAPAATRDDNSEMITTRVDTSEMITTRDDTSEMNGSIRALSLTDRLFCPE